MAALTTIAIAGLAIAAVGAIGTTVTGMMSAKQQKKAAKAQDQQARLQAQQERRRMIRQQRIARAQSLNVQAQVGATGAGTSAQGGLTSLNSQLGGGLGFATQMQGLSDVASKANRKSNTLGAIGGIFQGVGQIGSSMFSASGGFGEIANPSGARLWGSGGGGGSPIAGVPG